jgi:hypothetical protein
MVVVPAFLSFCDFGLLNAEMHGPLVHEIPDILNPDISIL